VSGKVKGGTSSEGQLLINSLKANLDTTPFAQGKNFVRLVGGSQATLGQQTSGSIQWPAAASTSLAQEFYGAVDLPTMPLPGPTAGTSGGSIGSKGRFAYWIGDEGIKAKANLPDVFATTSGGGALTGMTDWDKGFAGSAAQRSAFESVKSSLSPAAAALMPANFETDFLSWRGIDVGKAVSLDQFKLPKTRSRLELNFWAYLQAGASSAGDKMTSASRLLWHEITPYSYSVLSDTLNGGAGNDRMTGGVGIDTFVIGSGSDVITTSDGADRLDGGAGDDTLNGGLGNDTLTGGLGDDLIVQGSGDGRDLIIADGQDPDVLLAYSYAEEPKAKERAHALVDSFLTNVAGLGHLVRD
jgi:hypothetical protein